MMRTSAFLIPLLLVACGSAATQDMSVPDSDVPQDLSVVDSAGDAAGDAAQPDLAHVDLAAADLVGVDPCSVPSSGSGIAVVSATAIANNVQHFSVPKAGPTFASGQAATTVEVDFSAAFDMTDAAVAGNYVITPSLAVTSVMLVGGQTAKLTTAAQTPGQAYTVTVSNIHDQAHATVFAAAMVPFTGYQFHMNVAQIGPKQVQIYFYNGTVTCAAAQTVASYTVPGATVTAATGTGCGSGRTQVVVLTLAAGLSSGPHSVTASNTLTDTLSNAPAPLTVAFSGPGDPSALNIVSATANVSTVDLVFNADVDPTTAATIGNYTLTPAVAVGSATVSMAPNGNQVQLAATTTANTLYTLDTSGVLSVGSSTATTIPKTSFYGAGSFYPSGVLGLTPTQVRLYFSDNVGISASTVGNYVVSGGATAQSVNALNLGATLTVTGAQPDVDYTITMSAISSSAGVPISTGYSGYVDVVLSAAVDQQATPEVYLGNVDLTVNQGAGATPDGKHLLIGTGLLPNGSYSLRLCSLKDAAHTTTIGSTMIAFTVP